MAKTAQQEDVPAPPDSPSIPASKLPLTGLPLDALREVQDCLGNNMWMLGLPELAPFRAFILDAAAQCEAGSVERALREVRREAKDEHGEQQRQGAREGRGAHQ